MLCHSCDPSLAGPRSLLGRRIIFATLVVAAAGLCILPGWHVGLGGALVLQQANVVAERVSRRKSSRRLDIADSEGACQWATLGEAAASLPHQQTSLSRGRKEQRVLRVCCWRRAAFCGGVGRRPLRHRHKAEAHLIKKYNYVVFLAVQVVQVADGPAGGRQQRGQWAPLAADMALRQLPLEGDAQATSMQLLADRV